MTKVQSGRSMVEMLGVLAIIGVLSIGGIAGYTMAMNRHKANQVVDYATRLAIAAQTYGGTGIQAGHNLTGTDAGIQAPIDGVSGTASLSDGNIVVTIAGSDAGTNGAIPAIIGRDFEGTITYNESGIVRAS